MIRLLLVSILLLAAAAAFADTYHNDLDPSQKGGLTGVIDPPSGLQTVVAVEPFDLKAYQAQVDASGRFTLQGLPPGEYDAHYLLDDGYTSLAVAPFTVTK